MLTGHNHQRVGSYVRIGRNRDRMLALEEANGEYRFIEYGPCKGGDYEQQGIQRKDSPGGHFHGSAGGSRFNSKQEKEVKEQDQCPRMRVRQRLASTWRRQSRLRGGRSSRFLKEKEEVAQSC